MDYDTPTPCTLDVPKSHPVLDALLAVLLVLLQSLSEPGQIHVSSATYDLVSRRAAADWQCRGEIEVKGKGRMVRGGVQKVHFGLTCTR